MNVMVSVSALIYPTEIEDKVRYAIINLFPVELVRQDFGIPRLYGEGDLGSLKKLHRLLRESRILDTGRHLLLTGIEGNMTRFSLNKQVAYVGKVNFPAGDESLGSIHVEISAESTDDLLRIIDWLSPETVEGKPVREIEL